RIDRIHLTDFATMEDSGSHDAFLLTTIEVDLRGSGKQAYFMPLALDEGDEDDALVPYALANIRRGARVGLLYDAASPADFGLAVVKAMRAARAIDTAEGRSVRFSATGAMPEAAEIDPASIRRLSTEQSNTSLVIGEMILKIYRRLSAGLHPEREVGRFL